MLAMMDQENTYTRCCLKPVKVVTQKQRKRIHAINKRRGEINCLGRLAHEGVDAHGSTTFYTWGAARDCTKTHFDARLGSSAIHTALHATAAHLHRYRSEIESFQDTASCLANVTMSPSSARGIQNVRNQLKATSGFSRELERKISNILALVSPNTIHYQILFDLTVTAFQPHSDRPQSPVDVEQRGDAPNHGCPAARNRIRKTNGISLAGTCRGNEKGQRLHENHRTADSMVLARYVLCRIACHAVLRGKLVLYRSQ